MGFSHLKKPWLGLLIKSNNQNKYLRNQHGQALVEYILILVVSVTVVLGISAQIFKPMQSFLNDYMGGYTSCLLETGELPSFGGTQGTTVCQYKKFEPGAPLAAGSGSGSSGSGGSSSSKNGSGSDSDKNSSNSSSSNDSESSGSSSGGGVRSSSSSGRSMGRRSRGGSADGASAGASKVTEIAASNVGTGGAGFFKGNATAYAAASAEGKRRAIGLSGVSDSVKKEMAKNENSGTRMLASTESAERPPKKSIVKPPVKKPEIADESSSAMNFGNFLRIIFIAAIIIILVALMGGQVAQMMKSWEK